MIARKCNLQAIWEIEESMFMKILWATNMPWINVPLERNKKLLGKFDFFSLVFVYVHEHKQNSFMNFFIFSGNLWMNFFTENCSGDETKGEKFNPIKTKLWMDFLFFYCRVQQCEDFKLFIEKILILNPKIQV